MFRTRHIDRSFSPPPEPGFPPYLPHPRTDTAPAQGYAAHTPDTGDIGHQVGRDEHQQPHSYQYPHQSNNFPPEKPQHTPEQPYYQYNNHVSYSEPGRPLDRRHSPPSPPPPPIPVYVNNYGKTDHSTPDIQRLQYHPDPAPFHDRSQGYAGSIRGQYPVITDLNVDVDFDNDQNFVEREDTELGDYDQDYVDVGFHGQDVLYNSDQDDDIFTHQGGGDFG